MKAASGCWLEKGRGREGGVSWKGDEEGRRGNEGKTNEVDFPDGGGCSNC